MSLYGVLNGFCQVLVFPRLHNRWGAKRVFMVGVGATVPMVWCFPWANWVARREGGVSGGVWVVVVLQVVLSVVMSLSFGIYLSPLSSVESFVTHSPTHSRRDIYPHRRVVPEPRVARCDQRARTDGRVGDARCRARRCQLLVCVVDEEALSRWDACVLGTNLCECRVGGVGGNVAARSRTKVGG
jgi:hypothetical protein